MNFYGAVSAGYANIHTKEKAPNASADHYSNNDGVFAYQINPVGLNWSVIANKLVFFVEVGFGYKGVGVVGVTYIL